MNQILGKTSGKTAAMLVSCYEAARAGKCVAIACPEGIVKMQLEPKHKVVTDADWLQAFLDHNEVEERDRKEETIELDRELEYVRQLADKSGSREIRELARRLLQLASQVFELVEDYHS